jgi:hypothetical protein
VLRLPDARQQILNRNISPTVNACWTRQFRRNHTKSMLGPYFWPWNRFSPRLVGG